MKLLPRLFLISLAAGALVLAACGGDDDNGGSATTTPSGSPAAGSPTRSAASPSASAGSAATATATETPAPTAGAPKPAVPALDPGVKKIGEGTMSFVLAQNGQFPIDGLGLIQPGVQAPPCASFVFAFSWQVTKPFPPGDASVTWKITDQGVVQDVASGVSGTATVGCGVLTASNSGAEGLSVDVHYVQGEIQP